MTATLPAATLPGTTAAVAGHSREWPPDVRSCTTDELTTALYVSGFQPSDLTDFGVPLLTAFAASALAEIAPHELPALGRVLTDPDAGPVDVVNRDRLRACRDGAALLLA